MLRFRGSIIDSYMPSEDTRATDKLRVLGGRNIAWDALGPKSGFTTRRLSPFSLARPRDVQGLRVGPHTYVITQDAIMEWRTSAPIGWDVHVDFSFDIPLELRSPWRGIFINNEIYLAQRYRGLVKGSYNLYGEFNYSLVDSPSIPGIITGIRGLDIVRGRPIIVNDTTIQWGGVGNMSDFTPVLGGAGFQNLNQFVQGEFLSLTTFQDGFIVWTDKGSVVAEYIGGDAVWRFDTLRIKDYPLGEAASVAMLSGIQLFVSKQGVQLLNGANSEALTPDFNEFFRAYAAERTDTDTRWRVEYDPDRQQVFIMESTDLLTYFNTFVLYPTLNKWGIFSDRVHGILPLTNDLWGYVDELGFCHYFVNTINRGDAPAVELGMTRIYPRIQKRLAFPSSSAISVAYAMDAVTLPAEPLSAGWYAIGSDMPGSEGMKGMDSVVRVGYFRPAELNNSIDAQVEVQRLVFGSIESQSPETAESMTSLTNWKPDWFYVPIEDWNEDGPAEDWNVDGPAEDWMWSGSLRFKVDHAIVIHTSEDGITFDIREVSLSKFFTAAWKYASMTLGVMNVIEISAIDVNQYWHWKYLELQLQYGGESA